MSEQVAAKSGLVRAVGANLHYELAGDGPTLVLIHTGLADSRMFDAQFGVFARHCRALRYDLPGYGRSSRPDGPYSQHEVLRDLLRQLGIERATLLGASLGGAIALDFTLAYPNMVDALIMVAAGVSGYPQTPADAELFAPVMQAFNANDFTRAIDLMMHIWVDGPRRDPDAVDFALRERVRTLYTDVLLRSREGGPQAIPADPPAHGRLDQIRAPALVTVGDQDIPSVLDQAELIARSVPGARKVVVPDAAHLLNMEKPDELNRLVLDFLREHQLSR